MKLVINIFLYFLIALLVLQNHIVFAAGVVAIFTFRCGAVWLIPLAFLIDGYFGAFFHMPYISIATCGWYVISEFIRPKLLLQYESYGKTS